MAGTLTASLLPPHESSLWRPVAAGILILILGACGMVDYDLHEENLFAPSSNRKNIGVVHFHYADGGEPYDVRLRRVKGGYAVQAPLYETNEGSHVNFTAMKNKDYKYFVGVEGKFTF